MGKSTISMVIFNSYVSHNQRVRVFWWFWGFRVNHITAQWYTPFNQPPRSTNDKSLGLFEGETTGSHARESAQESWKLDHIQLLQIP